MHMIQYIARQTPLEAEEIEILALKVQEATGLKANHILEDADDPDCVPMLVDPCKDQLQILEERETLAGLKANCISTRNHLVSNHFHILTLHSALPNTELNSFIYSYAFQKIVNSSCSFTKRLGLHFLTTPANYSAD